MVLTPDAHFIVLRFASSLRSKCAKRVLKEMSSWISDQKVGPFYPDGLPNRNVFIADFVDINDNQFCKIVVDLNHKLL